MKGYGEKIKKYRLIKKLTQDDLGDCLGGVSKSFISKLENEKTVPNLEMLSNIAICLDVNIGDLLGGKQTPLPNELKKAGAEWMILGEALEKQGITPEQVKIWAEIVKKTTQQNE